MNGELCQQVISIAQTTAAFIQQERNRVTAAHIRYKGLNDLVSYVDQKAEEMLVKDLGLLLPQAGFITEENTIAQHRKPLNWIVDPLDGTTNFLHGVPFYCISIALMVEEELVLGVVYEMNLHECFYAWKGSAAYLNGNEIKVSAVNRLSESLIATGFPYTHYERMEPYMQVFDFCLRNTHGLRRPGSAALDLAYVAAGRFDAFYEYGLNAWDVAAGAFLVQQAGGQVSDFSGGTNYIFGQEIIAANAGIFDAFLAVVKSKFNG